MQTRTKWLLGGLGVAVLLWLFSRTSAGQQATLAVAATGAKLVDYLKNSEIPVSDATLNNANVQAFLKMIRVGEGTSDAGGYNRLFGGGKFDDFSQHPNVHVPFGSTYSTAAGAYQILFRTWTALQSQFGFPDFSSHSQDLAAVALIKKRGALLDVMNGHFADAVDATNKEWASLPGSPYGQPTVKLADAQANFIKYGGTVTA